MPNIIQSESSGSGGLDYGEIPADGYQYEYPRGLDLKPGSSLHDYIKNFVLNSARASSNMMKKNFDQWTKTDEKMTAYIPVTDKEKEIKEDDRRKPTSVVLPYSFVIAESILSYLVAAFFPDPIFRYEGSSPEDIVGAIMMEGVIQSHCNHNKVALNLHTSFYDAIKYGIGVAIPIWTTKRGMKVVKRELGFFDFMSRFRNTGYERVLEDAILFEGNALQNIDPYHYLPDPNVPVQDVQAGEFSGYIENTNFYSLMSAEEHDSDYFNVKYVRHVKNKRSTIYPSEVSERMKKQGGNEKNYAELNPVDVIWINATIVPSMFGADDGPKIGDNEYPEKWVFGLASDDVVIQAMPLGLTHNDYPVSVIAPDFDGYSPIANSRLSIEYGLQEILDYLLNSHIANLRKAVNDMIIVDPYQVNVNDLKNPKEGAIIRLRRPAWGRGVKDVAQQLTINDITNC